jgi:hypothetical protein
MCDFEIAGPAQTLHVVPVDGKSMGRQKSRDTMDRSHE